MGSSIARRQVSATLFGMARLVTQQFRAVNAAETAPLAMP
jgi:hypothetical protein